MKTMKKVIIMIFILSGCKGNTDADYLSGLRRLKRELPKAIHNYADSVNKESKKIDSLYLKTK